MDLRRLHSLLRKRYETEGWWPASSPWEVMVGALLTQQTSWTNVDKAIAELGRRGVLEPAAMASAPTKELEEAVRCCGFFRQKAERLRGMAAHIMEEHGGDPDGLLSRPDARERLLERPGVGPETADSILAFGAGRPCFVAAAYCSRILSRTGILETSDYCSIQDFVHNEIGRDTGALTELYALMVEHAKRHCRSSPRCDGCPLNDGCRFGP